jgi:Icc-related predicted phosphoesterase
MTKYSIVAISDTHTKHRDIVIPKCDFLIHAGDMSHRGRREEMENWAEWMSKQPACYLIAIMGNHEKQYEQSYDSEMWIKDMCPSVHLLHNSGVELEGIKFWGMPHTPFFHNWAYNVDRDKMSTYTDLIPDDTNVLITHGPPASILDEVMRVDGSSKNPPEHVGCQALADRIQVVKPDLHIFGHIHCGHGQLHKDGVSYFNVSVCDEAYYPSNPPTYIEYMKE